MAPPGDVSSLLETCLILISFQLIGKLEEKCNSLPSSHKKALSAESEEIMYATPRDVGIYYDDNGQHEVFTYRKHLKSPSVCSFLSFVNKSTMNIF